MTMPDFSPETVRDAIFTIEKWRTLKSLHRHGIDAPNTPLDILSSRNDRAEMMQTARAVVYLCDDQNYDLYLATRAQFIDTGQRSSTASDSM